MAHRPKRITAVVCMLFKLFLETTAYVILPYVPRGTPSRTFALPSRHPTALAFSSESPEDDTAEWRAIIAAFALYKAAYGDLKIPQRFVVPNMKPWPKAAWGMKLGKQVANIRSTGKYIDGKPARKKLLEDMGFVWRVRQKDQEDEGVSLEQIYKALVAYRKFVGTNEVPPTFSVPDMDPWPNETRGLPLGRYFGSIQQVLENRPEWREKFEALGVDTSIEDNEEALSANDVRFQKVYQALQIYKEKYGDLLVPQPFKVPETSDWPKELWGLRLGARVNAIRSQGTFINTSPERKEMLDDLGFVWNPPKERRRGRRPKENDAQADNDDYISEDEQDDDKDDNTFDDTTFDLDFSLDRTDGTAPTWGLENGGTLPELVAKQQEEPPSKEIYTEPRSLAESLVEATQRAKECGIIESITENNRVVKGKREKDIPWFNDDFGDDFVFEDVVEALTVYKEMYGDFSNLTETADFIIPSPKQRTGFLDDDDDDDELNTFFDVGASGRAAMAMAKYEDEDDLDSSEDLVAAEIRRLQTEVEDFDVATEKRRSSLTETERWPEHLAGMRLGSIVRRIRDGSLEVKHLPERKKMLDAIGFDWGDPRYFIDVPFEKAMCAMYAYYLVRGDMFVYDDFVMPNEDPWPQALAGYAIGKDVKRIRELQNFFEAYHPEKVSLLRTIDFVWFPTMALPLDPNEPEETSEMILLTALGHPDYSKMIDIPMGLPDKIIADGPFYETDDPKLWWRKWHKWDYVKDYWYQLGRRDNAFVLRQMGYPKMADEHEAKYGPGLFQQINETLQEIEVGIEDRSLDQKKEILEKLNFYRGEMIGCTDIHPQSRDELIAELDIQMLKIVKNTNLNLDEQDEIEVTDYKYEEVNGKYEEEEDEDYEEEEEIELEDGELDLDDELGLEYEQ